jgi:hypothetical protein
METHGSWKGLFVRDRDTGEKSFLVTSFGICYPRCGMFIAPMHIMPRRVRSFVHSFRRSLPRNDTRSMLPPQRRTIHSSGNVPLFNWYRERITARAGLSARTLAPIATQVREEYVGKQACSKMTRYCSFSFSKNQKYQV